NDTPPGPRRRFRPGRGNKPPARRVMPRWRPCPMSLPGSQRSVQRLVEEHYGALYRYAYRLSGSAADAEDLTQETLGQAQLKLHQLRDPARAKAWLFSVLRNAYLHRVRASKQEHAVSLEWVGDVPERLPEKLPEVEPEKLQQALNELPEVFR